MTTTNATRKLTKAGFEVHEPRPGFFHACKESTRYVIEYFKNGSSDEITCICVRHINDRHDSQSDYHAGIFANNISSAIRLASA